MNPDKNVRETDEFALKIIEIQYNTIRTEIEFYLARMFDVLKISLATIPILSGALIALVADQGTWEVATQRPILLGLFCLLSPMFVVIATYLGSLGIAQYKAVTRAADYIKVHFEDYLFQPILSELNKQKSGHVFSDAKLDQFLFWENYLSQHGFERDDKRFRNTYDHDKYVMTAFLTLLSISILVISAVCLAAFKVLIENSGIWSRDGAIWDSMNIFDILLMFSALLFVTSLVWCARSFWKFFFIIRETGALASDLDGGLIEKS